MSRILPICAGLSGLLLVGACATPRGLAQTSPVPPQPAAPPPGISVVGEGVVLAQPTTARVTLGTDVFQQSLASAQAEASQRMDAVVQRLKAAGIPDAEIHTVTFSINPQYDTRENQQLLRGYQVQNLVEVKTTDVAGLGELIDGVVAAGATRVFAVRFEAEDMAALKSQARDQAMQNARAKAEQLARDAGVGLARPTTIEESDTGDATPVRAPVPAAAPAGATGAPSATPIQPGELRVRTLVRVVWAIQ